MSIDKIKERIKMIESNDFNLVNEYRLDLPKDAVRSLADDPKLRDRVTGKISKAFSTIDQARAIAKRGLSGSAKVNVGNEIIRVLDPEVQNKVNDVFNLMRNHQILTDEIDTQNRPVYGYELNQNATTQTTNSLILLKKGNIVLEFHDNDLKDIFRLSIRFGRGFKTNDVNSFVNDLRQNSSNLGIANIGFNSNNQFVSIEY